MDLETILLLSGSALAAIAIGIIAYAGVSKRRAISSHTVITLIPKSPVAEIKDNAPTPDIHIENSSAQNPPTEISSSGSVASSPIQEAPAPFPEDNVPMPATPTPTDITALAKISSPIDTTNSAVLVIPTPKRRARTKRLPQDATQSAPRKRRSSRNKPIVPETTAFAEAQTAAPEPQPPIESNQSQ